MIMDILEDLLMENTKEIFNKLKLKKECLLILMEKLKSTVWIKKKYLKNLNSLAKWLILISLNNL